MRPSYGLFAIIVALAMPTMPICVAQSLENAQISGALRLAAECETGAHCASVLNPPDASPPPPAPLSNDSNGVLAQRPSQEEAACFETAIESPEPFLGRYQEVFRVSDGSWWEVGRVYEYFDAHRPKVWLCPGERHLQLGEKIIPIRLLAPASTAFGRLPSNISASVSSRIRGEFTGWTGNTTFQLENGEIWSQAAAGSYSARLTAPLVVIFHDGTGYKMQVEGANGSLAVTRVQ
ncbi:MAG: hypothetical protein P4L66_16170 [Acetobacteraceae bacterium]|nr:hypothetical protein [Acetobacteraceae bacterium]